MLTWLLEVFVLHPTTQAPWGAGTPPVYPSTLLSGPQTQEKFGDSLDFPGKRNKTIPH